MINAVDGTDMSSFTVAAQQSVAASSFFTISNPSGDSITQYSFEDTGGGSGYFTLAGTAEPDGQVIHGQRQQFEQRPIRWRFFGRNRHAHYRRL